MNAVIPLSELAAEEVLDRFDLHELVQLLGYVDSHPHLRPTLRRLLDRPGERPALRGVISDALRRALDDSERLGIDAVDGFLCELQTVRELLSGRHHPARMIERTA